VDIAAKVGALIALGDTMRIEETLKKAEMVDPRLPYWIEQIVQVAGGSDSPHYLLIAAAKLLSDSEQIIEDLERYNF